MNRPGKGSFRKSFSTLQNEIAGLKPEEREKVEKAKKILIKVREVGDIEAYRLLMACSLELNKELVEFAEAVIFGYRVFNEGGLKGRNSEI